MLARLAGLSFSKVTKMLEEALSMYRQNVCVLPMKPQSKKPDLRSWKQFQNRRPKESTVQRWFSEPTDRNLAAVMGPVSDGLICRDFDRLDAFDRWAAANRDSAAVLPQSQTGRGRHVFCRVEPDAVEKVSRTGASIIDYGDGELRGGGYTILPPSIHESGRAYQWLIPPVNGIPCVNLLETGLAASWSGDEKGLCEGGPFTEETEGYGGEPKSTEVTQDYRSQGSRGLSATDFDFLPFRPEIEHIIAKTLPIASGRRNKAVFELCRCLKAIPALAVLEARDLREIVLEWHSKALPTIQTKSPEETIADFYRGWDKVKFPAGEGPLKKLFEEVLTEPLPQCGSEYSTNEIKVLIALCRKLHRHWHPKPFMLSCRKAGELLNVSHVTASKWLYLLTSEGVLLLHEAGSQKTRKASRYYYCGD